MMSSEVKTTSSSVEQKKLMTSVARSTSYNIVLQVRTDIVGKLLIKITNITGYFWLFAVKDLTSFFLLILA